MEIVFLNQVSEKKTHNHDCRSNVINTIDGCIQSSAEGPDRLPKHFKLTKLDLDKMEEKVFLTNHTPVFTRLNRIRINRKIFGQYRLYKRQHGKKHMRYNQNHLRKLNNENNNTNSAALNKHPETIIRGNMMSSVAVIIHTNGSMLNVQHVTALPSALEDNYFVPSPSDVIA